MDKSRMTTFALAAAAASLFIAGCAQHGTTMQTADAGMVKCYGANSCKGQAECKTAMNECKGQNGCKTKGFVMMSEQACVERLGRA